MPLSPAELREWAAAQLGSSLDDSRACRERAWGSLENQHWAPDRDAAIAISILFQAELPAPHSPAFLTEENQSRIERQLRRSRVLQTLQTLPDLPLAARRETHERLIDETTLDPWARQRVNRSLPLIAEDQDQIPADSPLRKLTLTPSVGANVFGEKTPPKRPFSAGSFAFPGDEAQSPDDPHLYYDTQTASSHYTEYYSELTEQSWVTTPPFEPPKTRYPSKSWIVLASIMACFVGLGVTTSLNGLRSHNEYELKQTMDKLQHDADFQQRYDRWRHPIPSDLNGPSMPFR